MIDGIEHKLQLGSAGTSTASKPPDTLVNAALDCVLTAQTDINNPPASAMEIAVTQVDNACCLRLRMTMLHRFMS